MSVVSLNHIELATEEDKAHGIDYWARLFKAETWEELKILAEHSEYLKEAVNSVYEANADEIIRQKCRAREEYERHQRTVKRDFERLQSAYEKAQVEIDVLKSEKGTLQAYIQELEAKLRENTNNS